MKNFYIFKSKQQKSEKSPTHTITFIDESKEGNDKYVKLGGCWKKTGSNGSIYLSCQLDNPYKDRAGYNITEIKPDIKDTDEGDIDPNSIPF